jgi:hypothetical protein
VEPIRVVAVTCAVVTIVWVAYDAFELMLLPRRSRGRLRIAPPYFRASWIAWRAACRYVRPGSRREGFLSVYGPMSLVGVLAVWVVVLIAAFGVLQWALAGAGGGGPSLASQAYMSGVTFLTLGYGDVVPHTALGKVVAVGEAATGFGLLAVIVGYLPVLYQLFSRREAQIIRLDARAGSPPTATTLLVRHADGQRLDALDALLADWELWAAELAESQQSYPMLAFYRSQQPDECWLAALTAVLDTCALILVGFRDVNTFQARVTFGTARLALLEMARVFIPAQIAAGDASADRHRLSAAEFDRMQAALAAAGLEFSSTAGGSHAAAPHEDPRGALAKFRAAYEPFSVALGTYLMLPLPRWVAPEGRLDNWQRIEGAGAAQRLVEGIEAHPG